MKTINVGIVGLGGRGRGNLGTVCNMDDVNIACLCDLHADRIDQALKVMADKGRPAPDTTTDVTAMLARPDIEAVLVYSDWNAHLPLCIQAMKAGKYVATEVGGANSLDQCWELVHTSEETGIPCMLLENCCYDRNEMTVLNMIKKGLFGELIHAEGGYCHDLRSHISTGHERGHFRHAQNIARNGELYPTHELGPLAKWLGINRGNRLTALSAVSSKACGNNAWAAAHRPVGDPLASCRYNEGDVVTTTIRCANGETIVLFHNTSLPRPYSRRNLLQGTKGIWSEDTGSVYFEGVSEKEDTWESISKYYPEYEHPLWKAYAEGGKLAQNKAGHGGMDYLVHRAFLEAAMNKTQTPIDVYDTALWMAITCLSEDSIAMGGLPVPIPDFTNGQWFSKRDVVRGPYCLDEICDECFE